jgi:aromatic ring hydroxylase
VTDSCSTSSSSPSTIFFFFTTHKSQEELLYEKNVRQHVSLITGGALNSKMGKINKKVILNNYNLKKKKKTFPKKVS